MTSEAVIESRHDHDEYFCGLLMDYTIVSRSICDEVFRESDRCGSMIAATMSVARHLVNRIPYE